MEFSILKSTPLVQVIMCWVYKHEEMDAVIHSAFADGNTGF